MRFRLAGIPVSVHPGFFLTAVILGAQALQYPALLAAWVAIVFASVLLHELGHAFAFRALGHASTISLYFFGGHTTARTAARLRPGQDVLVSLAGPFAGFVLGGAVYLLALTPLWPRGLFAASVTEVLVWVNLGWGVLNLLPILPMDGGRVLAALLRMRDPDTAERLAHGLSAAFALLGLAVALRLNETWIALLCAMFAFGSFQGFRQAPRGGPEAGLRKELDRGFALLQAGDTAGALGVAESVAARARETDVRRDVARLEAWSLLSGGQASAALGRIDATPGLGASDPLLRGQALRAAGRAAEAVTALEGAFDAAPGPASGRALVAALEESGELTAAARLGESPRASFLDPQSLGRLTELLLAGGLPAQALLAAERRFDRGERAEAAWSAARASQQLGDEAGAGRWLRRAEEAGLAGPGHLERAPELRPLLERPEHGGLRDRLA
jgi:Zn-dependent protease